MTRHTCKDVPGHYELEYEYVHARSPRPRYPGRCNSNSTREVRYTVRLASDPGPTVDSHLLLVKPRLAVNMSTAVDLRMPCQVVAKYTCSGFHDPAPHGRTCESASARATNRPRNAGASIKPSRDLLKHRCIPLSTFSGSVVETKSSRPSLQASGVCSEERAHPPTNRGALPCHTPRSAPLACRLIFGARRRPGSLIERRPWPLLLRPSEPASRMTHVQSAASMYVNTRDVCKHKDAAFNSAVAVTAPTRVTKASSD